MKNDVRHKRLTGNAKISLICGFCSLAFPLPLLWLLPMVHWTWVPVSILMAFGVVFGLVGLAGIIIGWPTKNRMATTGIICGFVGAIGGFTQALWFLGALLYYFSDYPV